MTDYMLAAVLAVLAGGFVAVAIVAWTLPSLIAAGTVAAVCAWLTWDLLREAARWRSVERDDRDYLSGRTLDSIRHRHRRWDP